MKNSLIHNTHHLAKVLKKLKPPAQQKESHDVIDEKEMEGKSDISFHSLSSSSLFNREMERHLVQRKMGSQGITAISFENSGIFTIICSGRYIQLYIYIVVCK